MLTVILLSVQEWLDRDSAGHRADTEGDTSAVRSRVWSPATLQLPPRPPPAFTGGCSGWLIVLFGLNLNLHFSFSIPRASALLLFRYFGKMKYCQYCHSSPMSVITVSTS